MSKELGGMTIHDWKGYKVRINKDGSYDRRYKASSELNNVRMARNTKSTEKRLRNDPVTSGAVKNTIHKLPQIKSEDRLTIPSILMAWIILAIILFALSIVTKAWAKQYEDAKVLSPFGNPVRFVPMVEKVEALEPVKMIPQACELSVKTKILLSNNPGFASDIKAMFTDDWTCVAELLSRESAFNPGAINPSSGACGLGQALPCSKMACELSDVDCQLKWVESYVLRRYGSFKESINFHDRNGWY